MSRIITFILILSSISSSSERAASSGTAQLADTRPNILFAIADDWSFPHAGAYGDRAVSTPAFDRIAREGALFLNAFTAAPSCTPSRAALLTGQAVHRLAEGGNLHGFLPERFAVYPDILEGAGYHVGFMGKGWGPGQFEPGGRSRNPAGPQFKQFDEFLAKRRAGQPFAFWFGSNDPHRPYEAGSGAKAGLRADRVAVPGFFPDTPEVRSDLLDYLLEVQRFDSQVAALIDGTRESRRARQHHRRGDVRQRHALSPRQGEPVQRGHSHASRDPVAAEDPGRHESPAVRRPCGYCADTSRSGGPCHFLRDDRAQCALAGGGAAPGPGAARDRVFIERERHANVRRGDLSYPARAIRTADHLYIRNYRPDRWPAGDPDLYVAVGPFGDIDDGPTKQLLLSRRDDPPIKRYFDLAVAKRPAEELFDLKKDPGQLTNVAGDPAYAAVRDRLKKELDGWQRTTGDPRATEDDDRWDRYPYYGAPAKK